MPSKDTKILEFNPYQKSDKTPSIIYADLESLIKRIDGCKNNFEETSTTKVDEHIPSGYSMSPIWTFDGIENKHDVYRCEDLMKKSCESLGEHSVKIVIFKKKEMIALTNWQYEKTKICHISKKKFEHKYINDKRYHKVKGHCNYTDKYRGAAHKICNLKHSIPEKKPVVFHNGSNYHYHFIIKELAKRFEGV